MNSCPRCNKNSAASASSGPFCGHKFPQGLIGCFDRFNRNFLLVDFNVPKAANGDILRAALILGAALLFLYLYSIGSSHKSRSSIAEGEAILKDMDSYNANPVRTQAERKEIERRMREYDTH